MHPLLRHLKNAAQYATLRKRMSLAAWSRACGGTELPRGAWCGRALRQSMITTWEGGARERRRFLKLGMVMGGAIVLGGVHRFGRSLASAAGTAIPTVDQLVMTNVVDNIYDVFAKRGKIGDVTVQRTAPQPMPLSEHGLAYHLASVR